jgi:hypothetical protein
MLFSQLCTVHTLVFLYRKETFLKSFSFSIVFDHPSHHDTEHVLKDRIRIGYWMITTDPYHITTPIRSVADPDPNPDPPDPHVFGPPRSGSTSQRYGSGSFYYHV